MRKKIFISANQREFEKERLLIKNEISNDPILNKYYKVYIIEEINKKNDVIKDSYSLSVLNSEIYVGLIGKDYGKPIKYNFSATEYEYNLYREKKDNAHIFIKNTPKKDKKIKKFIENIDENHTRYEYFKTRQLIRAIKNILMEYLIQDPEIEIEPFEEEITNFTKKDIDKYSVDLFLRSCGDDFENLVKYMSVYELLISIDAACLDKNTFKLRNSGLLLFGKDIDKSPVNNKVIMRRFLSRKKKDIIDELTTTSNIFRLIEEFEDFFKKNTLHGYKLNDYKSTDVSVYPYEAVLEAFINAIAHNEYNTTTAVIEFNIYTDRIEICNAGCLKGNVSFDNLKDNTAYQTNKSICDILEKANYMKNKGSGINMMCERLTDFNQSSPQFLQNGDYFKVVIYQNKKNYTHEITNEEKQRIKHFKSLKLTKRQLAILSVMINDNRALSISDCCEIFNKSSSTIVNDLYWMYDMNILKREKKSYRYYFSPSEEFLKENIIYKN